MSDEPDAAADLTLVRLKALADPIRLAILRLLREGTCCNCEIAPALGLSNSLASHHLRILREAGLAPGALAELASELSSLLSPASAEPRPRCCRKS